MRKLICYFSILIVLLTSITACNSVNPPVKTYTVDFGAQQGGRIIGNLHQVVEQGESSQKVMAVADNGYYFAGWADVGINEDETILQAERVSENVNENRFFFAMFERRTFQVEYIAGEHGSIEGNLVQKGKFGDDTSIVTAVPDKGYNFIGWSDGNPEPTRKDQFIENKNITAIFETITKVYEYDYKFADSGCNEKSITLTYGEIDNIKFPVPKRTPGEFAGWYADEYLTQRVADENGNIVIGNELFFIDTNQLYAKWVTENTDSYKLLMIYVTELNAELMKSDRSGMIQVDYKMSDVERQICKMLTQKIDFELNDLAVSNFIVDEYFTTIPLTEENISRGIDVDLDKITYSIDAYNIPEVKDKLDQYDTLLVSFSLNDYDHELHTFTGYGGYQFATVFFDVCLSQLVANKEPFEVLLNPLNFHWRRLIIVYLHEFAHSIEMSVNDMPDYHKFISKYEDILATKMYLSNKGVDGEIPGIPYEYWENKIATVHYEAQTGGRIHCFTMHNSPYGRNLNDDIQRVMYGSDAIKVEARAFDGYEFVAWSDGVETAIRQDLNITEDLHVYAIFKSVK